MDQRRGNRPGNDPLGFGNVLQNPIFQFGGDGQANTLLRGTIINDALVADVAVITQNQRLQSKLHLVGVPQFIGLFSFFGRTRLVINGADFRRREQIFFLSLRLDQVHFRHDAQSL